MLIGHHKPSGYRQRKMKDAVHSDQVVYIGGLDARILVAYAALNNTKNPSHVYSKRMEITSPSVILMLIMHR